MNPEQPSSPGDFGLVNLQTLLVESETPTDWLVDGILPKGEAVLFAGSSHSGKTYALLDLGLAVAYGRPWLGRYVVPEARPVIYAPSEGRRGIGKRVRSAIDYHYPYAAAPDFLLYGNRLDLTNVESRLDFRRAIRYSEAALVIVDVLRDATPGVPENSDEFGDAFGYLRDLAQETGATIIAAHHLGKDTTKGSRGHSSTKDKADQEVIVTASTIPTADGDIAWTTVTLKNSKNRNEDNWGTVTLDLRKVSDVEYAAPVIVGEYLTTSANIVNPTHLTMLRAIAESSTSSTTSSSKGAATYKDIKEVLGISKQAANEGAKALEGLGLVDVDRTPKAHLVTLTDAGSSTIVKASSTASIPSGISSINPQQPIGAGGLTMPTTVEQLLDIARQEEGDTDTRQPTREELESAGVAILSVLAEANPQAPKPDALR